jgi:hypothetical protein
MSRLRTMDFRGISHEKRSLYRAGVRANCSGNERGAGDAPALLSP